MEERIILSDIPIDVLTIDELHARVHRCIDNSQNTLILYANAHLVQLAHYEQNWLIDFYKQAPVVICDGAGVQLGAKITRQTIPAKIPYNTWFWDFIHFLQKNDHSIYLLGGSQEVIDATVTNFLAKEPRLSIAGHHHGYFNKNSSSPETIAVIEAVNQAKADVLLIGFGMPVQEKWVKENRDKLNVPVVMTCGGAFDFFSGRQPVAPRWMRALSLEWFYRLLREPNRMFFRYTVGNARFLWLMIRQRLFKK